MLFSIIVPVYNVEKYLDECLESIVLQIEMFPNACEVILINDGSTDSSGKICDKYKEKYPNIIKVYHNSNQGLLLTRRCGFKMRLVIILLIATLMTNLKMIFKKYSGDYKNIKSRMLFFLTFIDMMAVAKKLRFKTFSLATQTALLKKQKS